MNRIIITFIFFHIEVIAYPTITSKKSIGMKYVFSLILVMFITQLSAQFTKGKYINIQDTCYSITFLDSNQILKTINCYEENDEVFYDIENNIERDLKKDPYTYYKIEDYIDSKKEYIVNTYYSDGIFSHRFSIINKGYYLVITGMKGKGEIKNHYTASSVYLLKDSLENFMAPKYPRETIVVNNSLVDSSLLIAYGQNNGDTRDTIYLEKSPFVKTTKIANPELFAYRNYDVFLKINNNLKSLPVIYNFKESKQLEALKIDTFAMILRFNPLRDDVVNTSFEEKIEGQVLTFNVYTMKHFRDRYSYLLLDE